MSLITPQDRMAELEADRNAIAEIVRTIRIELTQLRARAVNGELGNPTEAVKVLADVKFWLRAARETELELQKMNKERAGIAHDYAIDLDRARADLRCRLDRLRSCCKQ
ncbi:hypothetical protein [Roseivivax isoporae]|uniref:Uncharacterized protein n=1 Tax=Roseivivax isoporae LMG 25204 TaxID=1449351 RepID=X7F873_9RHOB|nr:hypothetical protein [Roseivivax isoporae]ETX28279.1 hypothetical protein RISW2_08990 [Roseivivax isoporae LMG 25204]